jgi:hypothetical protein
LLIGSRRERLSHLRRLVQLIGQIPRQQLLDTVDRVLGDALENVL